MSEIPPKHSPETSAYEGAETGSGLVAMYTAASHANAESFPVLKAFQDYIEAERAQARKRVMQLSIFFAVLMGVVVTGFLTAGIFMLRNMSNVQTKLLDVALANKTAPVQPSTVAPQPQVMPIAPFLEESIRQMSRVTTELQSSLDKQRNGLNETATKMQDKVASQDGELEKLRAEFCQMQERSAKLNDELVALKEAKKKTQLARVGPAPALKPTVQPQAPDVIPLPIVADAVSKPGVPMVVSAPRAATEPVTSLMPLPPAKPVSDPRFPPQVKEPPSTSKDVTPPPPPQGMLATAIPLKTKNIGTIPWRVLIPE